MRSADPDFLGDPYQRYGGRSLHTRSHGESFLEVFKNRIFKGLYLLDEPDTSLSPQRQLALLSLLDGLVQRGESQFIIATHSPILLTLPDADIFCFDDPHLRLVDLQDTLQYQITHDILESLERYWKYLRQSP